LIFASSFQSETNYCSFTTNVSARLRSIELLRPHKLSCLAFVAATDVEQHAIGEHAWANVAVNVLQILFM
jgi:hypothetical protein